MYLILFQEGIEYNILFHLGVTLMSHVSIMSCLLFWNSHVIVTLEQRKSTPQSLSSLVNIGLLTNFKYLHENLVMFIVIVVLQCKT